MAKSMYTSKDDKVGYGRNKSKRHALITAGDGKSRRERRMKTDGDSDDRRRFFIVNDGKFYARPFFTLTDCNSHSCPLGGRCPEFISF